MEDNYNKCKYHKQLLNNRDIIRFINTSITDDCLMSNENALVHSINSISCYNYGVSVDIVNKYPYANIASLRKQDNNVKWMACHNDRSYEGSCCIHSKSSCSKYPNIATLVSQYSIGNPYNQNLHFNEFFEKYNEQSFKSHIIQDTLYNRIISFNKSIYLLGNMLKTNSSYNHIKRIFLPMGLGRDYVDIIWINKYYPIIEKFAYEMKYYYKQCYLVQNNSNINNEYLNIFEEMKQIKWKNLEEYYDNNIECQCNRESLEYDVPDTQRMYII